MRYGPKIVTDSLALCLDAHEANSYAGEPTTNLVSSSAIDFSVRSTYTGNTFSQVVDSESPSGYACEMSYTGTVNSSSRSRFGGADNIPTSGTGFVSIWAKKSAGSSTTMRPKVYTGYTWYHLEPLDGGSIYFTDEYRPFGIAVTFGTNSGGPNPGFSMTHAGGSTENDKTRWIKPQVTTLSYNVPFANLSRSATNGWADLSGSGNHCTLTNIVGTGVSHYKEGQLIKPLANSYLDFDGTNDYIYSSNYSLSGGQTFEVWFQITGGPDSPAGILVQHDHAVPANFGINHVSGNKLAASIGYTDGTREYSSKTTTTTFSHDVLYHVALVYDTSASKIIWYVNGAYDNQSTLSKTPAFASKPFVIGRWSTSYNNYYFDGNVYKASVYSKTLSATEVKQNFEATRQRFGL